jgi:chromosome segregation ATPase
MTAYVLLAFLIGACLGYLVFYLRYADRSIIDELRVSLTEAQKDVNLFQHELEEYTQQNIILKQKASELLAKNTDLSKVVSDLSRYYYRLKSAANKVGELNTLLQSPEAGIEEKINEYKSSVTLRSPVVRDMVLDTDKDDFF